MKKFLVLLLVSLVWSTSTLAESCSNFIDVNWRYEDRYGTHVNKGPKAYKASFTFKSTSSKTIKITAIGLLTSSDQEVTKGKKNSYIPPFGKKKLSLFGLDEINLDVVKTGFWRCRFEEKPASKKYIKRKQKSWSQKMLDKIRGN
tara:strand:+ start:116 stop:550 length:435 start_codon:yes stop_codon:yes gene_type:complete